jgi:hypothetical protein
MTAFQKVLAFLLAAICLGVFVDVTIRVRQSVNRDAFSDRFFATPIQTNGMTGIMVGMRSNNVPIWIKWNSKDGTDEYLFRDGKNIINVVEASNGRSQTQVIFYGKDGDPTVRWTAQSTIRSYFYMREFFTNNGADGEVWWNDKWNVIEVRTNAGKAKSGITLDGQWYSLIMSNGILGLKKPEPGS